MGVRLRAVDVESAMALRLLNVAIQARGGTVAREWPTTWKGWSPVEQLWAFQPWVSRQTTFDRMVPCWYAMGALRWWGTDQHFHVWLLPGVLQKFVERFDAGEYPELVAPTTN
jgi:hypothetical protein